MNKQRTLSAVLAAVIWILAFAVVGSVAAEEPPTDAKLNELGLQRMSVEEAIMEEPKELSETELEEMDERIKRVPFRGLAPLYVVVPELDEKERSLGVSEQALRASVELPLRQSGIPLRTTQSSIDREDSDTPEILRARLEWPTLHVYVRVLPIDQSPTVVYSVSLELKQTVSMKRNDRIWKATTWDEGMFGITPASKLSARLEETLTRLAKSFCNNYLAANPR